LDDNYQAYLNRMMRATLPEAYQAQVNHIQESSKFSRDGETWVASQFPGYTVVTPPGSQDGANAGLYDFLTQYQAQVTATLGTDLFIPIPRETFHLTIADLIWDRAYAHAVEADSNFDEKLQASIAESFQQSAHLRSQQPIPFRAAGLMVMTRALSISLAATDETSYQQIIDFRRSVYQNPHLMSIGIEQQYHFTPHITLGYFGSLTGVDRVALAQTIDQLNQPWLETEKTFWVKEAQLRRFSDMEHYDREATWATFEF
jgi:2'-5' RNA ligase